MSCIGSTEDLQWPTSVFAVPRPYLTTFTCIRITEDLQRPTSVCAVPRPYLITLTCIRITEDLQWPTSVFAVPRPYLTTLTCIRNTEDLLWPSVLVLPNNTDLHQKYFTVIGLHWATARVSSEAIRMLMEAGEALEASAWRIYYLNYITQRRPSVRKRDGLTFVLY